jgi:hypothetical protein
MPTTPHKLTEAEKLARYIAKVNEDIDIILELRKRKNWRGVSVRAVCLGSNAAKAADKSPK